MQASWTELALLSIRYLTLLYKSGGQKIANKTSKTIKFNKRCQIEVRTLL